MLGHSPRPLKSYPGEDALALPPLQLGPEDREELLLREAHEADPGGGLDRLHRVVLPEAHPDLAVHGDHDVLVRHERDLDTMHAGEDDRPVRQGVGADRRQHDRVHGREQDRPAGREVVGGRAGGCRDDEAVGTVRGGVLSLDGHREVDDATHRGLGDDDVVEGGVLPEPLAVPDDARGQHHALVHRHPAREQRLERREQPLERRRGEEAEPAEVHAEEGYPQIANRARHGEEGPVAAEHDEQVHLRRQLRLAHGRDARRRDQPGGLLLQDRGEPPRLEPLEEFLDRGPGLARAGLRHDADALHASASTLRSIMDSRSLAVRPWLEQWRKNSRLPFGPRSGEAVTPSTCQPRSTAYRARRATAWRWSAGSRTTPPLPTASRPTSNWGFTSAMTSPRGASTPNTEGRTFSNEMNATSMTASVGCSPKIRGSSARALVFSMTTTRGSLRSLASSWPTPTSTAYTRAAPRWSRQSVKPPVEAPTSRQTRPAAFIWKASSAWASFSPPRLTNGERPWSSTHASLATRAPALLTRLPSTRTSPARMRRAACSRLSTSPRSTSRRSMRTRAAGLVTPFIIGDRPAAAAAETAARSPRETRRRARTTLSLLSRRRQAPTP